MIHFTILAHYLHLLNIHCTYCTNEIISISLRHQIIRSQTNKKNIMKTLITLTTIFTLIFSGLLISGLVRYNLAINATQQTDGSDIEITDTMYSYGFNLDVFETPTTADYITSNFK